MTGCEDIRAQAIRVLAEDLLTVKEYAHITRLNPEYIRQQCRLGKLKGARRIGGQWRIVFSLTSHLAAPSIS